MLKVFKVKQGKERKMWSVSLPTGRRSNDVNDHVPILLHHPYIAAGIMVLVLIVAFAVVMTMQNSAASTSHVQSVADGRHSTVTSWQQPASASTQSTAAKAETISNQASASSGASHTQVTVNGQTIPVPANGSVHTTVPSQNSKTSVDVSAKSSSNGTSVTSSSTSIQVNSSSQSDVSIDDSQ